MRKFLQSCAQILLVALLSVVPVSAVIAQEYAIDPSHTSIGFAVKHLMVSTTKGAFSDVKGTIQLSAGNLENSNIDVTIQVASIDTRNTNRDNHLRSADFFDNEKYPTITFKSRDISRSGDNYLINGDLTIKGVTKRISLPVKIHGPVKSPFGFEAIGIVGNTVINRQDFGITWNKMMDEGGYVVGNEVTIDIDVEAHSKG